MSPDHLPQVIEDGQVETILGDNDAAAAPVALPVVACAAGPGSALNWPRHPERRRDTEWVLLTSGTTGRPKLVAHTLGSLIGPVPDRPGTAADAVWSTFYDVRRYGGLQILLRALLGGGSMVFSDPAESVAAFLRRVAAAGVTHISGTPSHWRRALMSSAVREIAPRYIRLSGEMADQAILNRLAAAFPDAKIGHAFASTEAGVAFEVNDGLAGFPAEFVGRADAPAELRVRNNVLSVRSPRVAHRYLGGHRMPADADGFVETGDVVVLRGDRYHFAGRREGVINVGGQKVYPEEVEAIIARHPEVRVARVRSRANPVTGALVTAEVVVAPSAAHERRDAIKAEILGLCRAALPAHKVPALLQMVSAIELTNSGKVARRDA